MVQIVSKSSIFFFLSEWEKKIYQIYFKYFSQGIWGNEPKLLEDKDTFHFYKIKIKISSHFFASPHLFIYHQTIIDLVPTTDQALWWVWRIQEGTLSDQIPYTIDFSVGKKLSHEWTQSDWRRQKKTRERQLDWCCCIESDRGESSWKLTLSRDLNKAQGRAKGHYGEGRSHDSGPTLVNIPIIHIWEGSYFSFARLPVFIWKTGTVIMIGFSKGRLCVCG